MAAKKTRNCKRSKGKGLLSVEVPEDILDRFRRHVRSRGGRMGFEVARLLEAKLNQDGAAK